MPLDRLRLRFERADSKLDPKYPRLDKRRMREVKPKTMPLTSANTDELLRGIKFDANGLVAGIVLDAATGHPLMFAFLNREALARTIETGKMHYYSRSRNKLWLKGETSGHVQTVREIRIDCDADAILFKVEQIGGACHTGYYSCFYRKLGPEGWIEEGGEKVFDPGKVYQS